MTKIPEIEDTTLRQLGRMVRPLIRLKKLAPDRFEETHLPEGELFIHQPQDLRRDSLRAIPKQPEPVHPGKLKCVAQIKTYHRVDSTNTTFHPKAAEVLAQLPPNATSQGIVGYEVLFVEHQPMENAGGERHYWAITLLYKRK